MIPGDWSPRWLQPTAPGRMDPHSGKLSDLIVPPLSGSDSNSSGLSPTTLGGLSMPGTQIIGAAALQHHRCENRKQLGMRLCSYLSLIVRWRPGHASHTCTAGDTSGASSSTESPALPLNSSLGVQPGPGEHGHPLVQPHAVAQQRGGRPPSASQDARRPAPVCQVSAWQTAAPIPRSGHCMNAI